MTLCRTHTWMGSAASLSLWVRWFVVVLVAVGGADALAPLRTRLPTYQAQRKALSKEEEVALDRLMAAADAGFGSLDVDGGGDAGVEGAEFFDTFKTAMKLMDAGRGGGFGGDGDVDALAQFEAMAKHIQAKEEADAAAAKGAAATTSTTTTTAEVNDGSALAQKLKGWAGDAAVKPSVEAPQYQVTTTAADSKSGKASEQVRVVAGGTRPAGVNAEAGATSGAWQGSGSQVHAARLHCNYQRPETASHRSTSSSRSRRRRTRSTIHHRLFLFNACCLCRHHRLCTSN